MRRFLSTALVLLWVQIPGLPRTETGSCSHDPDRWRVESHLHSRAVASRLNQRASVIPERAAGRDIGEIAVLEDSGGVVARRNPFNLDRRSVRFLPSSGAQPAYRYDTPMGGFDAAAQAASSRLSGLGDDDTRRVDLPFPFRFYGTTYRAVFVNSDGNLTFDAGDVETSDRSLGRMRSGPPRIALLFEDLDPSSGGTVSVLSETARLVVTWSEVPVFQQTGTGPRQTAQVRLYADGRIEMSWSGISAESAVVGISPGGLQGETDIVAFLVASAREYTGTLAERFSSILELDVVSAAHQFYRTHDDSYDYLVFFNNMGIAPGRNVVAYQLTVRSNRSGIGDPPRDVGREYGSARRLQSVLNLGSLGDYPVDPNEILPVRSSSRDTPLTILGHETGHLFLAFVSVRNQNSPDARPMLGRQLFHWNFFFNSDASLLEGNRIRDDGEAASPRFLTTAVTQAYSPLDQYLMGFRAPEEVPPTFLVEEPSISRAIPDPQVGVRFNGKRRNVAVEDLVAVEGRRTPDHTVAQRRFRFAFVLVVPEGSEPTQAQLEQIDRYRREFEAAFERYTGARAWVDTGLRRALHVSLSPAAGVIAGSTATASVWLERPAATPLALAVETRNGTASVPTAVTIAQGATRVIFEVRGLREGVEELKVAALGADASRYETAWARLQVAPASMVKLIPLKGLLVEPSALRDPLEFSVTDVNGLPYPGLRVTARPSAGGQVDLAEAVTDDRGTVRFRWTPGAAGELAVAVSGGPSVTVATLSRPSVAGILNAASWQPQLSPGSIAVAFGSRLAGAKITAGGARVEPFYSDNRQVNFTIPASLQPGAADIVISGEGGSSDPFRISLGNSSPGIFFDSASGFGAVRFVTSRVAEVYGTGLGPTASTGLRETLVRPDVFLGGQACEVLYSGMSPAITGLYQVNIRIPDAAAAGTQDLVLSLEGARSNTVKVQVPPL